MVTDDIDLLDTRGAALGHGYQDTDSIAIQGRYRCVYLDSIFTTAEVLPTQFQLNLLQQRTIENPTFSQADLL